MRRLFAVLLFSPQPHSLSLSLYRAALSEQAKQNAVLENSGSYVLIDSAFEQTK